MRAGTVILILGVVALMGVGGFVLIKRETKTATKAASTPGPTQTALPPVATPNVKAAQQQTPTTAPQANPWSFATGAVQTVGGVFKSYFENA